MSTSTGVPMYMPLRSSTRTGASSAISSISFGSQSFSGSSLNSSSGYRSAAFGSPRSTTWRRRRRSRRAGSSRRSAAAADRARPPPRGEPVLSQGEVEGGRLVRPAPVVARGRVIRAPRRRTGRAADQLAGLAEGRGAGEVEHRAGVAVGDVVEGRVDDVLADALLPAAMQMDDGRGAGEVAVLAVVPAELVALDLDRQLRERS